MTHFGQDLVTSVPQNIVPVPRCSAGGRKGCTTPIELLCRRVSALRGPAWLGSSCAGLAAVSSDSSSILLPCWIAAKRRPQRGPCFASLPRAAKSRGCAFFFSCCASIYGHMGADSSWEYFCELWLLFFFPWDVVKLPQTWGGWGGGTAEAPRYAGAQCSFSEGVWCCSADRPVVKNTITLLAACCVFVEKQLNVLCHLWKNNRLFFPTEHRRLAENVG